MSRDAHDLLTLERVEVKIITGRLCGDHTAVGNSRYFWRVEVANVSLVGSFSVSAAEALLCALTEAVKHDSTYQPALDALREAM